MFSALPPEADIRHARCDVCLVPIVLQNPQNAVRLIFRKKTKQTAIVDRYSLKLSTEVADGFGAR
jgi:hypothetical protein